MNDKLIRMVNIILCAYFFVFVYFLRNKNVDY